MSNRSTHISVRFHSCVLASERWLAGRRGCRESRACSGTVDRASDVSDISAATKRVLANMQSLEGLAGKQARRRLALLHGLLEIRGLSLCCQRCLQNIARLTYSDGGAPVGLLDLVHSVVQVRDLAPSL